MTMIDQIPRLILNAVDPVSSQFIQHTRLTQLGTNSLTRSSTRRENSHHALRQRKDHYRVLKERLTLPSA
jgi:hypothetical protein